MEAGAAQPARFIVRGHGGWWAYAALLVAGVICGPVGFASRDATTQLLDYWILPGVLLVGLVVAHELPWGRTGVGVGWRALGTSAGIVAAFVVGARLVGAGSVPDLTVLGAANAASAALLVGLYRAPRPDRPWVPERIGDVMAITLAAAGAAFGGLLLGAFPPTPPGGTGDARLDLWNACWQFSVYVVTALGVLPLCFRRPVEVLPSVRLAWWPVLALLAVACTQVPDLVPTYPVDWVFVVPAVVAGSLMRLRTCAFSLLVLAVWWAVTPYADYPDPAPDQLIAPEAIVDLVLGFISVVAVVLVVYRERAAVLAAGTRQRAVAESEQETMLAAVLSSMTDAVLLTDRDGRVLMGNDAARAVANGTLPDQVTVDWVNRLGLRTREGLHADQGEVDRLVRPEHDRQVLGEIRRAQDGGERRYLVTASPVETDERAYTLLLARDITAEHSRFQRLEWFATAVASDLTGPLTVLDRRIDLTLDAAAALDATDASPAGPGTSPEDVVRARIDHAQEAVAMMRSSIEDYLVRAVSRGDGPADRVLELAQVGADLSQAHQGEDREADLTVAMPHRVVVDAHLIPGLFANALAVAVEELARRPRPRVQLSSRPLEDGSIEVLLVASGRADAAGDQAGDQAGEPAGAQAGEVPPARPASGVPGARRPSLAESLCRATVARHGGRFDRDVGPGRATLRFTLPGVGVDS